jgi:hypothetical protein
MRGERRGFLLDRGLLGHGRCGGRGLVPLDRLRLARHRAGEHLVHARDRNDLEPTLDAVRDFDEIPTARSDPFGSWAASPDFPDAQTYNFAMPKRSPNFELNLDA